MDFEFSNSGQPILNDKVSLLIVRDVDYEWQIWAYHVTLPNSKTGHTSKLHSNQNKEHLRHNESHLSEGSSYINAFSNSFLELFFFPERSDRLPAA